MAMRNTLMSFLSGRTSTTTILTLQYPTLGWRCYSSPPSTASNNKPFVGGLSWSVDEKSLKDALSSFKEVTEVKIIYDKDSGRYRGFGFIHYLKKDDVVFVKDAMDGKALLGRPLRVSFAFEKAHCGPVVVHRLSNTTDGASHDAWTLMVVGIMLGIFCHFLLVCGSLFLLLGIYLYYLYFMT